MVKGFVGKLFLCIFPVLGVKVADVKIIRVFLGKSGIPELRNKRALEKNMRNAFMGVAVAVTAGGDADAYFERVRLVWSRLCRANLRKILIFRGHDALQIH